MADTFIGPLPPGDGRDWDCQCARCGSSVGRVDCESCGAEGFVEVYEEDPINNDPDDTETCRVCHGQGGWRVCLSEPKWCEDNPRAGRIHARGVIEWFTHDKPKVVSIDEARR